MSISLLIIGLIAGALIGWFVSQSNLQKKISEAKENSVPKSELKDEREKILNLTGKLSALQSNFDNKKAEIDELQKKFTEEFENIANKIVNENSQRIQQQHKEKLDDILNPFKDKIEKFEKKVDETHKDNIRENQSLKEQIAVLQKLNQSIGEEAKNLTTALKGQVKKQGNWGEIILERVLEMSGLTKGREYLIQESLMSENGRRLQPDVVIQLPDNKNLVIDSKVSLVAYEKFSSAEDDVEKVKFLNEHIASVRKHIRELGEKNYQKLYDLHSLDFVIMFVPIEPAFNTAVGADEGLYNDALKNNIVLVSTSTLLATLRTISSIWKHEYQNRNAMEIAKQSADLYDKFSGLLTDLVQIGKKMDEAKNSYSESMKKLSEGKGNLISRVEKIRKLGVKPTKEISQQLLDRSEEFEDAQNENINEA